MVNREKEVRLAKGEKDGKTEQGGKGEIDNKKSKDQKV
jgi:hypothetical protein